MGTGPSTFDVFDTVVVQSAGLTGMQFARGQLLMDL